MLRFLAFVVLTLLLVVIGLAVFAGVQGAELLHGVKVTVDGETFDAAVFAAGLGGAIVLGVLIIGLIVIALLASIVVVVPIVILAVLAALILAAFAGLAPIVIPVLLVVGAYVLLSRWSKRRTAASLATRASLSNPTA